MPESIGEQLMGALTAHNFEHVYKRHGLNLNDLGCVMLDVKGFELPVGEGNLLNPDDMYVSPDPAKDWIAGDVVSTKPHVTLLYGLLHEVDRSDVRQVLEGWTRPAVIETESIEVFPSPWPETEPYGCIVAKIRVSTALAEAHARLSFLPHVDTHMVYTPHVTLAYVNAWRAQAWADVLKLGQPPRFETVGINFGDMEERY